jgi:hypothetical protein
MELGTVPRPIIITLNGVALSLLSCPGAQAMSKTIEKRLENVERELAALKGEIKSLKPDPNWISSISGTFKDDPEFDEVLRLGKELRDAEQPVESE